jgi:hypothetical protein
MHVAELVLYKKKYIEGKEATVVFVLAKTPASLTHS